MRVVKKGLFIINQTHTTSICPIIGEDDFPILYISKELATDEYNDCENDFNEEINKGVRDTDDDIELCVDEVNVVSDGSNLFLEDAISGQRLKIDGFTVETAEMSKNIPRKVYKKSNLINDSRNPEP